MTRMLGNGLVFLVAVTACNREPRGRATPAASASAATAVATGPEQVRAMLQRFDEFRSVLGGALRSGGASRLEGATCDSTGMCKGQRRSPKQPPGVTYEFEWLKGDPGLYRVTLVSTSAIPVIDCKFLECTPARNAIVGDNTESECEPDTGGESVLITKGPKGTRVSWSKLGLLKLERDRAMSVAH
jgi:hypothetical protein